MSAPSVNTERYELQDSDGQPLPDDATDYAIVIDRVAGLAIDVRGIHVGDWDSCTQFAAQSTLAGRQWTLPTLDFLSNHVIDRTRHNPAVKPLFAKLAEIHWRVWSADPFAGDDTSSPGYAWGVYLHYGLALVSSRDFDGLALPVSPLVAPAGQ
jgi:hypothetical protein